MKTRNFEYGRYSIVYNDTCYFCFDGVLGFTATLRYS